MNEEFLRRILDGNPFTYSSDAEALEKAFEDLIKSVPENDELLSGLDKGLNSDELDEIYNRAAEALEYDDEGEDEEFYDEEEEDTGANPRGIEYIRETFTWGSFGKDGKSPLKKIPLKEISDSHLVHIIGHLVSMNNMGDTLIIMLEEARYRNDNNIYIADYVE